MIYRVLHCCFISTLLFLLLCEVSFAQNPLIRKADSLFLAKDWRNAKKYYEAVLKDTSRDALSWNRLGYSAYNLKFYKAALKNYERSLSLNPSAGLKSILYSRMAKIHALNNDKEKAYIELDSAVSNGYVSFQELDTLIDFKNIREEKRFKDIRQRVYVRAYPCMGDAHAREFDFWIGEWDVYQAGTKTYAGHSLIQVIAGGCALLENWDSPASTGKSINFIDPVTNKWKQSWAGSYANGTQEFVNGEYKDGAMRFEYITKGLKGEKVIGRFIFYNQGPNQVRQFNEFSADEGKTWTTSYDFTYFRRNVTTSADLINKKLKRKL